MSLTARTFHVVGGDGAIESMMKGFGCLNVPDINAAEIVMFSGGSDVSPKLYGQKRIDGTYCDEARDEREIKAFGDAGLRMKVGICRGGQFLNVINGGSMWQDVDNHALNGVHELVYYAPNGLPRKVPVTSTHHQMMRPLISKAILWGSASQATWRRDDEVKEHMPLSTSHNKDVEIVFYPSTRSLCFQPHPEYKSVECRSLFEEVLLRAISMNLPREL